MRVPSTKMQNNFGKYLKFVEAGEEIIVTKSGKDAAEILPCPDTESVREEQPEYRSPGDWVTYAEFLELTETSEQRFELIDGVIYNPASPSYKHQHAVGELYAAFHNWFKGKSCEPPTSPFDVTFVKEENTSMWYSRIFSSSVTRTIWMRKANIRVRQRLWWKSYHLPQEVRIC